MDHDRVKALETRLSALEGGNRRLRRMTAALACVVIVGMIAGAQVFNDSLDIREQLLIRDRNDKVRFNLNVDRKNGKSGGKGDITIYRQLLMLNFHSDRRTAALDRSGSGAGRPSGLSHIILGMRDFDHSRGVRRMTQLLEQAIGEARKLPESEQDAIAVLILEELEDERRWDEAFASSQGRLAELATKVRQDIAAGRVRDIEIDEL